MAYGKIKMDKKPPKPNASLDEFRSGERRKKTPVPPKPNIYRPTTPKPVPPKARGGR